MPRMTRSLSPMQPSVGNKVQFLVEEPQVARASCTYKRRKEHVYTSAPYKLADMQAAIASEWRSCWLAPHVRVHTHIYIYTRACTRQCGECIWSTRHLFIRASRPIMRIYRYRARGCSRDRHKSLHLYIGNRSTQSGPAKLKLACPI